MNNFIELYRIRIKSPDDIRFTADGDLSVMVTPALFVPLLENGFKFASFRNRKPGIDIRLYSGNGMIEFEISNICELNSNIPARDQSGFGLMNLRKRLELSYPDKYKLLIEPRESEFLAKLTIDTNGN